MRTAYQYRLRPTKQQAEKIDWHDCPHCGCSLDRDHNAAINLRNRAVGQSALKAKSLLSNSRIVLEAYTDPAGTV